MIENWDVIKHEKFMDVAFEVEFAHDLGDHIHLVGYWWNQGYEASFLIPYKDHRMHRRIQFTYPGVTSQGFQIKKTDLDKWFKAIDPRKQQPVNGWGMGFLRNCQWVPV